MRCRRRGMLLNDEKLVVEVKLNIPPQSQVFACAGQVKVERPGRVVGKAAGAREARVVVCRELLGRRLRVSARPENTTTKGKGNGSAKEMQG